MEFGKQCLADFIVRSFSLRTETTASVSFKLDFPQLNRQTSIFAVSLKATLELFRVFLQLKRSSKLEPPLQCLELNAI